MSATPQQNAQRDDQITEAITQLVATEYNQSPIEINRGLCNQLADAVCARVSSAHMVSALDVLPADTYVEAGAGVRVFGSHTWVVGFYGRHYDAEAPEGVDDWWDLPWCQRQIQQSEYDSVVEVLAEAV